MTKEMKIATPNGVLEVVKGNDENNPGVWITLKKKDSNGSLSETTSVLIEFSELREEHVLKIFSSPESDYVVNMSIEQEELEDF